MSDLAESRLGIVGAGAVAAAFAQVLAGAREVVVWARREDAAHAIARMNDRVHVARRLDDLADCDIVVIAVSDDALGEVAERLAQANVRGVVLHTSGVTTGAEALAPLLGDAVSIGSVHPLVAVVPGHSDPFRTMPFAVEASNERGVRAATDLVLELGGKVIELPNGSDAKVVYHALATMVASGVVTLVDRAAEALAARGEDVTAAQRNALRAAYARLAESAARNVHARAGAEALTGAFARGDEGTVARHRDALRGTLESALYEAIEQAARRMLEGDRP